MRRDLSFTAVLLLSQGLGLAQPGTVPSFMGAFPEGLGGPAQNAAL